MNRTVVVSVLLVAGAEAFGQWQGQNSSAPPYMAPIGEVATVSLLTVGDEVPHPDGGTYTLAGRPEGIGIFENNNPVTFTLLVNHNLKADQGVVREHGAIGSFISRFTINQENYKVQFGEDHIKSTWIWNAVVGTWVQQPTALARLSSGHLAGQSAFFDVTGGLGTLVRLYLTGEELGEGRAFATIVDTGFSGLTFELPRLGNISWQNCVAASGYGVKTVVAGMDGPASGEVYIYIGTKTDQPGILDSSGLTNGSLYGVQVQGLTDEDVATGLGGPASLPFSLVSFGDVSAWDGATLQTQSDAEGVMGFLRPRDAHWDRNDPRKLYFVTNGNNGAPSRVWLLEFADLGNPEAGGTLHLLLDGTEGIVKADGILVDDAGNVLIQESPGIDPHFAGIWYYVPQTDELTLVAESEADFFAPGQPGFLTINEESTGIVDARETVGEGWYILANQAHYTISDPELVEGGQLLGMYVQDAAGCIADVNEDGEFDVLDLVAYQSAFVAKEIWADLNFDQEYNVLDFVVFNFLFGAQCD